jgi:hypothetical protein
MVMAHALPDPAAQSQRVAFPAMVGLRRPVATMLVLTLLSAVAVGAAVAVKPIAGVLGVVAVAGALALAYRPRLAVYLMVTVAPACAGFKRGLLVPGLRVSEFTVAGLAMLVLVFAPRTRVLAWTRVEIVLLVYAVLTAALGGLDLALRHAPLNGTELGTLLGPFQFMLLLRAVVVALDRERDRIRAAHLMLAAATVVGFVSLAQFGNVGPTRSVLTTLTGSSLYSTTLGEGAGRVTGPFNIWHELAGFLMPSVVLSMALLLGARSPAARMRYGIALAVTGGALLSTAAIGPLSATALACLYISWKRGVLHVVLAATVPVVLIVALAFGGTFSGRAKQQYSTSANTYRIPLVPQTIAYRYAIFREQSAPALAGHWASGFGPDLPPQLALGNFPFAETTYVTLVLRGGVPLLAVFLILMLLVGRAARRAQRSARSYFQWSVATVVFTTTVSYALLQLIESYLLDSGPPHAYWAFVGLMLAAGTVKSRPLMDKATSEP